MTIKLFDSELKVMEVLWREGCITARQLADVLEAETGWNKNTTYTVIKKCIAKNAIERQEPNFVCKPLISKEEVQAQEADELINKIFDGSAFSLFSTLVNNSGLSSEEVDHLKALVEKLK